jgi:hypothetical protein
LRRRDRLFWIALAQTWPHWRAALVLVQPDTVVQWPSRVGSAGDGRGAQHGAVLNYRLRRRSFG